MTALLATPTPYLRDGLRRLVAGLRKDAETVRLNLAVAEQDVADARQILAEAEAQHKRAKDAADALTREIAFFEEQAERTPPAYDPDAALAATGLMPREEAAQAPVVTGPERATHDDVSALCTLWAGDVRARNSEPFPDDDLTAPGVADSRAQVAPHLPPPVPHDPAGVPVATHGPTVTAPLGPTVTTPDAGLAHPVPNPPSAEARHAKPADRPGLLARLTGGHRTIRDEQDGDQTDG